MGFYVDPAFFIVVAALLVPAVVLGLAGRRIGPYGLVVSVVMLALLFGGDARGAASLVAFVLFDGALTWFVLRLFDKERPHPHRVGWYRFALALSIVPLCIVKVTAVFDANVFGFVGVSYITFKAVQVLIEIRDGLVTEMAPLDFLYFLLFFPVFTSGPITRSRDFIAQARQPLDRASYVDLLAKGALWFLKGFVYSLVLASFFQCLMWFAPSALAEGAASQSAGISAGDVAGQLAYGFSYGLYLFFNFAGYSFMAMGVGAALGIRVPTNFRAPFRSIDIKDFWNRWHITLSFWLRDYVFMRMSKAFIRRKTFKSRTTTACVGFIVEMTLMGVWHGLTASMIAYGMYHGVLLAACELFQKKSKLYKKHKNERWFKTCSWAITMVAVFFGFALFSGQVESLILGGV